MAENKEHGGACSRVFDYSTLFEDGIGEILERLDGEDKESVADELLEGYDMPALMEMRVKIFRFAKGKLMKSLEAGPGDLDTTFASYVPTERLEDAQKAVAQWVMIARRKKEQIIQDSLLFLSYLSGEIELFPHTILRRNSKKRNRSRRQKKACN